MLYNIYISTHLGAYNVFGLSEEQLEIVKNAYLNGEDSFTIAGKKRVFNDVDTLLIFQHDLKVTPVDAEKHYLELPSYRVRGIGYTYLSAETLARIGKEVTFEIIGNSKYGESKQPKKSHQEDNLSKFISADRLAELKSITSATFDISKLIKLCEEINDNYQRKNFLSVGMIGRTILNHVPPIFGFNNFEEIANNYGTSKNSSFKKNMSHLNSSLKNIADSYLHLQIRKKESLPNEIQVDFKQDIDVLLAEIIRIL